VKKDAKGSRRRKKGLHSKDIAKEIGDKEKGSSQTAGTNRGKVVEKRKNQISCNQHSKVRHS